LLAPLLLLTPPRRRRRARNRFPRAIDLGPRGWCVAPAVGSSGCASTRSVRHPAYYAGQLPASRCIRDPRTPNAAHPHWGMAPHGRLDAHVSSTHTATGALVSFFSPHGHHQPVELRICRSTPTPLPLTFSGTLNRCTQQRFLSAAPLDALSFHGPMGACCRVGGCHARPLTAVFPCRGPRRRSRNMPVVCMYDVHSSSARLGTGRKQFDSQRLFRRKNIGSEFPRVRQYTHGHPRAERRDALRRLRMGSRRVSRRRPRRRRWR